MTRSHPVPSGYILLFRSLQDHWLFRERRRFSRCEAWIDLLMLASWSDHPVCLMGFLYRVQRGDVLRSQRELAKRWNWSEKKLRGFLKMLQQDGMIEVQTATRKVTQI